MRQSFPKVQKNSAPERHFFKTCGRRRAINGKSYRAKINAAILAYLILEGSHTTDDIAATFFSFSRKDELSKYIGHLKNQLAKFGAEGCLVQEGGQLNVQAFDTDYRHLLEACKRRNIAAIKELAQGKFLEGVKVEGAEALRWIAERENERNEAIWQAFLHTVALGQIPPTSLETAFELSSDLPSSTSLCFIYLYDLLGEQRVSTTIKHRMLELLPLKERLGEDGLKTYVETRRDYFKHKGQWQSPLELWGNDHGLDLPDTATDSNPAEVRRSRPRLFNPFFLIVGSLVALFTVLVGSVYLQQEARADSEQVIFRDDFENGLSNWQFGEGRFYLGEGLDGGNSLCTKEDTHYHFAVAQPGLPAAQSLELDFRTLERSQDGSINLVFNTSPSLAYIYLIDIFSNSGQIAKQAKEGYVDYGKAGEFFYDRVHLTNGEWHHIEIRIQQHYIQVFLNNAPEPVARLKDENIVRGNAIALSSGGGSWSACIDNVVIRELS